MSTRKSSSTPEFKLVYGHQAQPKSRHLDKRCWGTVEYREATAEELKALPICKHCQARAKRDAEAAKADVESKPKREPIARHTAAGKPAAEEGERGGVSPYEAARPFQRYLDRDRVFAETVGATCDLMDLGAQGTDPVLDSAVAALAVKQITAGADETPALGALALLGTVREIAAESTVTVPGAIALSSSAPNSCQNRTVTASTIK